MKPSYIILTDSGERFYLKDLEEFNPNEYANTVNDWAKAIGLYIDPNDPTESYCYKADLDERFMDDLGDPTTATTIAFKAYDEAGNVLFEGEGGNGFWL